MQDSKLHYDFAECRELAHNVRMNDQSDFTEASKYFHERVFLASSGAYYFYHHGQLKRDSMENFQKVQMMGFPKKFIECIRRKIVAYEEVLEMKNYRVDKEKRKINAFREVYGNTLGEEVVVTDEAKEYVEFFKKYLLEVSCSGSERLYNWLVRWCASLVQLKRTKVAPVFVTSTEGIGKTTLAVILEKILGEWNATHPSAEAMRRFHWQCYAKLLVVFEETEGIKNDVGLISDNLKNMINSDKFSYEEKGIPINDQLRNINNVFITSNFPLPNSAGRRYMNITPSTKWLNRYDLFDKLFDLNDAKIKALYEFFMSFDIDAWNAEKEAKEMDANAPNLKDIERMNNAFRFMRDTYALSKTSEKIKTRFLYESYCESTSKPYNKSTFYDKVSELNVVKKKTNGIEYFYIDGPALFEEFEKRRLIDHEELMTDGTTPQEKQDQTMQELLEAKEENDRLRAEIEKLKSQSAREEDEKSEPRLGKSKCKVKAFTEKKKG